jgi:hypothetical protein
MGRDALTMKDVDVREDPRLQQSGETWRSELAPSRDRPLCNKTDYFSRRSASPSDGGTGRCNPPPSIAGLNSPLEDSPVF